MENFTKEYVEFVLKPYEGKSLRLRTNSECGKFNLPFMLETEMESTFQIELNNMGIKFLLKDNFYIKKQLNESIRCALKEMDIFPFSLDKLLKEEPKEDCEFLKIFTNHIEKTISPQIAFTYYNMVSSIKVESKGFSLNGFYFQIY